MTLPDNTLWQHKKVIIFDVDGTLYNQSKLRKKMAFKLLAYYILRPWRYRDLLIIKTFREEREKRAGQSYKNLQEEQFKWCADKLNLSVEKVKKVVLKWMFEQPNRYLHSCIYPEITAFFETIREEKIPIAIYSDYPAKEKLNFMKLKADFFVSSTDDHINALKPLPNGLMAVCKHFNIEANDCLFIGDRHEMDGLCAENAGMPYYIIS